jgi:phosphatidylethanolamine/phosphatidyl-N-methylethanolamine N-methyltransferase
MPGVTPVGQADARAFLPELDGFLRRVFSLSPFAINPRDRKQRTMPLKTLLSYALFGGAFLSDLKTTGSVIPSSPFLGRRMAEGVPQDGDGLVIELGVGTGAITHSLVESGIDHDRLVAVDCSEEMVNWTRQRFPEARVLLGDASKLRELLAGESDLRDRQVSHVVSSLPLKSLPGGLVRAIADEVREILPESGRLIQFTYDLRPQPDPQLTDHFSLVSSSVVWCNFPPARVSVYQPA